MRRQQSDERDNNMPTSPILPKRPMMPDMMPQMPQMPQMPPCIYQPGMPPGMFPPGTAYNPIGVPPGAIADPVLPPGRMPTPTVPAVPPGRGAIPVVPVEGSPVDIIQEPGPPVMVDTNYIQGYLRTLIGQYVKVEFILGANMLMDREGVLKEVGIDHIVLQEPQTDDLVVADLYSIKFVKVFL